MADPKQTKKPLSRCGERVVLAKLSSSFEGAFMFGAGLASNLLREEGTKVDGKDVTAMYLHPSGLLVIPKAGAHPGKRIIIPGVHVVFAAVAEEEG